MYHMTYERYAFNTNKQLEEEPIDKFILRLQSLVKTCDFGILRD